MKSLMQLGGPTFEVDGKEVAFAMPTRREGAERRLRNGAVEADYVETRDGLTLRLTTRAAAGSPVVRFRYSLTSDTPRRLTKRGGREAITYATFDAAKHAQLTEVRMGEFQEPPHAYTLREEPVPARAIEHGTSAIGPILAMSAPGSGPADGAASVLAYEHGSTYPDAYLRFDIAAGPRVALRAAKGNHATDQLIDREPFESVWFLHAAVDEGGVDALAAHFREFIRLYQSENLDSRKPLIFYNTWNYQERKKAWYGTPYLDEMHQTRMLAEIGAAHRMGIETFVIDTGWYAKTGDWRVNLERFPDNLQTVKRALDERGMRLGLWFDNAAAVSSDALAKHRECVMQHGETPQQPHPIWETEDALRMCLVSRYWEAFADELIRVHREVGVSYFKWDAIHQYGCDRADHDHGDGSHSAQERGERYSYLMPIYLTKIVNRICAACPGAIVDFDMTETGRIMGLGFLSAGKIFLINNGAYYWNYDIPKERIADGGANLFFHPGPARTWFTRQSYALDRWVPANLFLCHYLPDDPENSQVNGIASLILGHNGIWGDLPRVSAEGQERFGSWLASYKQVRDDIAAAAPVRSGTVGGSPEVHEKINPANGRGAVVMFATQPGRYEYVTERRVGSLLRATPDVESAPLPDGRVRVVATFESKEYAKIALFA